MTKGRTGRGTDVYWDDPVHSVSGLSVDTSGTIHICPGYQSVGSVLSLDMKRWDVLDFGTCENYP